MNISKIAAGALALLLCAGANAHRVNIFAWIEGDQVVTESKFSSGSRVQKGAVTVKNAADGCFGDRRHGRCRGLAVRCH